jgi:monofunctional glycosyltransferase
VGWASKLSVYEAARRAVMLPRPKYFDKRLNSAYLASRSATIAARVGDA